MALSGGLIVSDSKIEKKTRPIVKCPHCEYECRGKQALGRHISYHHPEKLRDPKITLKLETITELLTLVNQRLKDGQLSQLSDNLSSAVKEQDLNLHLTLAAIAASKAERAVQLEGLLNKLVSSLISKLERESAQGGVLDIMCVADLIGLLKKVSDCVISDTAIFSYKCSDYYNAAAEGGIIFNDPDINIDWPITTPDLSPKDAAYPMLKDIPRQKLPRFEETP